MAVSRIPFVFPGIPGVRCAFQIRYRAAPGDPFSGGNIAFGVGDDVRRTTACRMELARLLEADGVRQGLAEVNQVHGDVVIFDPDPVDLVSEQVALRLPEADGLATSRPGVGLLIKTADCQPVLLAHRDGRHVAALHVGWRGNRMGFVPHAVAAFCDRYGLHPQDLSAVRGPSLGPSRTEFVNYDREWGPDFAPWHDVASGTVDLWRLTRDQLVAAGLAPNRIFGLDLCTASLADDFFSYRRNRVTGRQASVIVIG